MNTRSFFLSALISGALIGLLGNLPLLNLVNCIFCLWVWVGGIFAVFLYQRFQRGGRGLTTGQGAGLGAVSGIIGALIGLFVFILTSFISMPLFTELARALQIQGDLPFEGGGFGSALISAFFFLTINAVLYPIFGAIGGLVGAGVFWKETNAQ
jgi:hypothetical protein